MITKGDKFLCIKNVEMNGNPEDISYFAGKIYESEFNGHITNEQGSKNHSWSDETNFTKFFTRDLTFNNGGSTDYWKLPQGSTDLQDLIEYKEMPYSIANIFKAAYRMGDNHHSSKERDLNKIIWFANRELKLIKKNESKTS